MLEILDVPDILRRPTTSYPVHSTGPCLEAAFEIYARQHAAEISTEYAYIPILWWNNYFYTSKLVGKPGFVAELAVQRFLHEHLDPNKAYFTVTECDDGIYEWLPPTVLIFGAGGQGHIPIPLLCDSLEPVQMSRSIEVSFLGSIETGGPMTHNGERPTRSSWDRNGDGARIRRKMLKYLKHTRGYSIKDQKGLTPENLRDFVTTACSSKYSLAPRGYGKTSFRLYETMQLGSVPIYIYDEPWLPYTDQLDWSEFCILVQEDRIPEIPNIISSHTESDRKKKAKLIQKLWKHYFTMEATCRRIVQYVETA